MTHRHPPTTSGRDWPPPHLTLAQQAELLQRCFDALDQWCPCCIAPRLHAVAATVEAIQADPAQPARLDHQAREGARKDRRLRRWFAENIAA